MKLKEINANLPDSLLSKSIPQRFNQIRKQRQSTLRQRNQLLTDLFHGVKTALNAIAGFSELLSDEGLSSQQSENIQFIHHTSTALNTRISSVLELLNITAGEVKTEIADCSVKQFLHDVAFVMRPSAQERALNLEVIPDDSLPETIQTDFSLLRQCLFQLAENAIQSSNEGLVSITAYTENCDGHDYIRFDFQDTGPYIPPAKQKLIFEPALNASDSIEWLSDNTLELAITNQMVKLLGGRLAVTSRIDHGSLFSIVIPARVPAELHSSPADITPKRATETPGSADRLASKQKSLAELPESAQQKNEKGINALLSSMEDAYKQVQNGTRSMLNPDT